MFRELGFKFAQIKGMTDFGAQKRGCNRGNFGIPLANHWPECTDIWYEASLEQDDSSLRK